MTSVVVSLTIYSFASIINEIKKFLYGINAFSDADYASCLDSHKVNNRFLCVLGRGSNLLESKEIVYLFPRSSTEAEYCALASITCELIWLH